MFRQNRVHGPLQSPYPFPMNDPDLKNAFFVARGQIIGDQVLDFTRFECVQIQHACDRQLDRSVHRRL